MQDRNTNRPGYKKTKAGWIPNDWDVLRVNDAGAVQAGRQRSPHFTEGKLRPYLRVANIYDGYIDSSDVKQMMFTEEEFHRYHLRNGDILLNEGQSLHLVGRCAKYTGVPSNCCFQNTLIRFRPNGLIQDDFCQILFAHLQKSGAFAKIASQTTSIAHLGVSRFANLHIPVPTIVEQKKIAKVFFSWDDVIDKARKLITAKKSRKKALMQKLLMGKVRLPSFRQKKGRIKYRFFDFPADWECPSIREIAEERSERNSGNGKVTVLSCSKHEGLIESSRYFGKQVFSENRSHYKIIRRGWFGYPSNHIEEGSIGLLSEHDIGIVSPIYTVFECANKVVPEYLYALFKTDTFRHIFAISTNASVDRRGSLRWQMFSLIRVPLPGKDEQQAIANVLAEADREIIDMENKLKALEKQKRGLMQKLLTGEVRVKT